MSYHANSTLLLMRHSCCHCQRIDLVVEQWSRDSMQLHPSVGAWTSLLGSRTLHMGPFNPGLATGLCEFYKVYSLAVATRMSHK